MVLIQDYYLDVTDPICKKVGNSFSAEMTFELRPNVVKKEAIWIFGRRGKRRKKSYKVGMLTYSRNSRDATMAGLN